MRQKVCSVEVLKFLLLHGVDEVRRREIRGKFIGDRDNWKRPATKVNGKLEKPAFPLSDSELQHILNKLILGGYVKKEMVCPDSKRTKDRQKMDVYYRVSLQHLKAEDWLGEETLIAYRTSMSSKRGDKNSAVLDVAFRKSFLARSELRRLKINDTSDDDLDSWLKDVAVSL